MCEFNVIVNGKIEFKDVIYTKVDGDKVTVKNIMGQAKEFSGFRIVEVDVPNTRMVLVSVKP
jgi:predicted RNA-binding protein